MQLAKWTDTAQASITREILKITQQPGVISFAGGAPAPELFPMQELAKAFAESLQDPHASLQYTMTEGFEPLRASVAEIMAGRGLSCSPQQIALVHGSQQGLDLTGRLFLEPNDLVLVEQSTYHGAVLAYCSHRVRYRGIPMDDQGMLVEEARQLVKRERPKLIYCMPTFHNPTGLTLPLERRQSLVELAAEFEIPVIEDDPYAGIRYQGQPSPVLKALDRAGQVIYVGSFSKILAPGLRLGWVVGEPEMIRKLNIAQMGSTMHVGTLLQRAVQVYLESGQLPAHIERLSTAYRARRDAMLAGLESEMTGAGKWTRPEGGFFVWVELEPGLSAGKLLEAALAENVAFVPGDYFFVAGGARDNCIRLAFSTPTPDAIAEGFARLGRALRVLT